MELDGAPAGIGQVQALATGNYGHFTTMIVDRGRVQGLALHLARLAADCREVFGTELDLDRVRGHVRDAVGGADEPVVVRATVFDPELGIGDLAGRARPRVLVTTRPAARAEPRPWRLHAVEYRREEPRIKHVGLFGALRRRREAQRRGFDDALFTDRGALCELTTSNIGLVRGDRVVWPDAECLPGVTMSLLRQAEPAEAESVHLADLSEVDAVFATNAATGLRPITAIDSRRWPASHPVLDRLRAAYAAIPGEEL